MKPRVLLVGHEGLTSLRDRLERDHRVNVSSMDEPFAPANARAGVEPPDETVLSLRLAHYERTLAHVGELARTSHLVTTVVSSEPSGLGRAASVASAASGVAVIKVGAYLPGVLHATDHLFADRLAVPGRWAASWYAEAGCDPSRIALFGGALSGQSLAPAQAQDRLTTGGDIVYWPSGHRGGHRGGADAAALEAIVSVLARLSAAGERPSLQVRLTGNQPIDEALTAEATRLSRAHAVPVTCQPSDARASRSGHIVVSLESETALDALAAGALVVSLAYLAAEQLFGEYDGVAKIHAPRQLDEALVRLGADPGYSRLLAARRDAAIGTFIHRAAHGSDDELHALVLNTIRGRLRDRSVIGRTRMFVQRRLAGLMGRN
jgi:hypothetical protein